MDDFDQLMCEVTREAEQEGPQALAQLAAFEAYFSRVSRELSGLAPEGAAGS